MAPPISKRSKQNSPTSPPPPIPLPGVALGLFAAIAAGFAASRALRRKRPAQSLQDERQSISAGTPPFKEREIESKEGDDSSILITVNGTITIAQEPSKPAAGLKPVFDAFEELSCVQKMDAEPLEEGKGEDEEGKGKEEDCGNGQNEEAENGADFEEDDKEGEPVENGKNSEEEGESEEIFVKIEASLTVDDTSVEALQSSILEVKEKEEEEEEEETEAEGKGKEVEDNGVIDDGDLHDDGYGNRNSVDQQPSPVLINGRVLDFFEEMPDFKDEPDLLLSGSNSLSDAVSESSMQEVSSAPVKPFVPSEETLEAMWPRAKPEFSVALNQSSQENAFPEAKNWSYSAKYFHPLEDGSSETRKEASEFVENLSQTDRQFSDLKHDGAILNDDALDLKPSEHDVDVGLLNLKPVLVEIEEKKSSADKVNQINFEILSDVTEVKGNSIAFKGKVSIEVNGLDERVTESSTINGKLLSNGSSLLEELDDLKAIGDCEHLLQSTREGSDDFTGLRCKGETIAESVQINGKVLLDESPNDPCIKDTTTDETSSQTGQEGTEGRISDSHGEPDLLAALELSGDETRVSSECDIYGGESAQEMACLGSEELAVVEGILEEPEPQHAAQKLDDADGTNAENNVKVKQEQSSAFIASKEITEGNKLSCEGNTNNVNREDISDGLSGQIVVKDRIHSSEQEIEEVMRSCDANDLVCERTKLTSLTGSARVAYNTTRDPDYLLPKEAVHQHGLEPKGVSVSKILEYLPLEIGFICLLIALVSSVLWYLEVLPLIRL